MKTLSQPMTKLAGIFALLLTATLTWAFTPAGTFTTTTLYFSGNVNNAAQVADPSRWAEDNPSGSCGGSTQACAMTVNLDDVTGSAGSRVLNGARITLGASGNITAGYIPFKLEGESDHEIIALNKN